jgi:hypothetical protein
MTGLEWPIWESQFASGQLRPSTVDTTLGKFGASHVLSIAAEHRKIFPQRYTFTPSYGCSLVFSRADRLIFPWRLAPVPEDEFDKSIRR